MLKNLKLVSSPGLLSYTRLIIIYWKATFLILTLQHFYLLKNVLKTFPELHFFKYICCLWVSRGSCQIQSPLILIIQTNNPSCQHKIEPYYVFHYFNSRKATTHTFSGECLNKEADQSNYDRDVFQEPEMLVPWNLIWGKALSLVPLVSTSKTFCFLTSTSALQNIPRWIWAFTETRLECAVVVFSLDGSTLCINGCLKGTSMVAVQREVYLW